MKQKLLLASQSPFRKQILTRLGFEFESVSPKIDEREIEKSFKGNTTDLPEFLAEAKAKSVLAEHPDSVVIGSDQILYFESQKFDKPATLAEAQLRLANLQGKTHQLLTGLCVATSQQIYKTTVISELSMRSLSEQEIANYIALDQPIGCAGAYKIESHGSLLFEKVSSPDYDSIVGLPVLSLVSILKELGISRL